MTGPQMAVWLVVPLVFGSVGDWFNNTFRHDRWVKETCIKWNAGTITQGEALRRMGLSDPKRFREAGETCKSVGVTLFGFPSGV